MKLHRFPFAPNAAKVRLWLAEKAELGCEIPVEEGVVDQIEGEQKREVFLALNPLGKWLPLELDAFADAP